MGWGGAVADLRMSYLGRISSFSLRRPWRWQGPLGKSHSQLRQEAAGGILEETENSGYGRLSATGGRAGVKGS